MSTFQVVNPFQQFFGLDGLPLTSGYVYIGTAGGDPESSPIPVYSDQALTIPLSQPLRTIGGYLANGTAPTQAYVGASPYSMRVRNAAGSVVYYQATAHDGPGEDAAAAIAAIAALGNGSGATELGYNAGVTASVDRTVAARLQERVSILDFYTAGDASYSIAVNKFIAWANANGGFKTLWVPGRYTLGSATLTTITVDNVFFDGPRTGGFILTANAPTFHWYNCFGGGFNGIGFSYSGTPGASAELAFLEGTGNWKMESNTVRSVGRILRLGSNGHPTFGTFVRELDGDFYNGGVSAFELVSGALLSLQGALSVAGVPTPASNRTSTMVTVSGTNLINLANDCSWDTINLNIYCERFWRIISAETQLNRVLLNVTVDPMTYGDYIRDDCYHFVAGAVGGGVFGVRVFGYANSWEGNTFWVDGPGVIRDGVVQLESLVSGKDGISINGGANTRSWRLMPSWIGSADRLNTGKTALRINGNEIQAGGGFYGQFVSGGDFPWQPAIGVTIAADLDDLSVQGMTAYGATGKFSIAGNAAGFINRIVANNINADYAGYRTDGVFATWPTTGVMWTNTSPHTVMLYFSGLTDIAHNGVGLTQTQGSLTLAPGDTFTPAYPGATNHHYKVLP
jgi:hypothetical protein